MPKRPTSARKSVISSFPRRSPSGILALLAGATSETEIFAIIGRAGDPHWDGTTERDWAAWAHKHTSGDVFAPGVGLAILTWAVQTARPWADVIKTTPPGDERRHAIWQDVRLVPVQNVLSAYRAHGEAELAPEVPGGRGLTMDEVVEQINAVFLDQGPDARFEAWATFGSTATAESLKEAARTESRVPGLVDHRWRGLASHPASNTETRARAVTELARRAQLDKILDCPGLFDEEPVRRAARSWIGVTLGPRTGEMLVRASTPPEFKEMVETLAGGRAFSTLGLVLEWGSPEQRAAVRITPWELALWCEQVPVPHRPVLLTLAANMSPATQPRARKARR